MPDKPFLTVKELAELLQVPESTIYQWRWEGKAPRAAKIGRHLRFKREDVEAWIEAHMDPGV